MPFIRIPGTPGRFFVTKSVPEGFRKYICSGCRQCQVCSDERCRPCRAGVEAAPTAAATPETAAR